MTIIGTTARTTVAWMIGALALGMATDSSASVVFSEDFEDGLLAPQVKIATVGTFLATPGIKPLTQFGSSQAFGFGLSTCSFDCYSSYVTSFNIDLGAPVFVETLAFKEIELFENWGSNGGIFLDGLPLFTGSLDFGRLPYNDRVADFTFRDREFTVNRTVTQIELLAYDITRRSEIAIDDIVVTAGPAGVSEPNSLLLLAVALLAVAGKRQLGAGSRLADA